MCEEAGVRLEYLPPYSPDFNPIEKSFAGKYTELFTIAYLLTSFIDLKAWIRRNREIAASFGTNFGAFLELAVNQSSSQRQAKSHFKSCFIYVEADEEVSYEEN